MVDVRRADVDHVETAGPADRAETVATWLADARRSGLDRLDAQLLLGRALGRSRTWLLAHDDAPIPVEQRNELDAQRRRRAAGEPIAYLLGEKEFHGLRLQVGPGVLVPRPDTETLVDWALECLASLEADRPPPALADLGTGSGAIALALKHARPDARVTAVDASPAALQIATGNGARLGLSVDWVLGDWWAPLAGRRFDLVVSNPPYVADGDPHLTALAHEPIEALCSGPDGLRDLRKIVAGAAPHLGDGGWLLLEHGHDQADAVAALLAASGFVDIRTRRDLAGQPRCTGGRLRALHCGARPSIPGGTGPSDLPAPVERT